MRVFLQRAPLDRLIGMMFDPHATVEVVTLRDERASEADAIGRVIVAAFAGEPEGGQFERRIVDTLRADGVERLAHRGARRPPGHVAFSPVSIGGEPSGSRLALLRCCPDCQRQSIGAGLVRMGSTRCAGLARARLRLLANPRTTRGCLAPSGDIVPWRAAGVFPCAVARRFGAAAVR